MKTRIAAVQIATLPASRHTVALAGLAQHEMRGEEFPFLFQLDPGQIGRAQKVVFNAQYEKFPALLEHSAQFRARYPAVLSAFIRRIVQDAERRDVSVIVFPEYSIPAAVLGTVAALAQEHRITIVAGTHSIGADELHSHPLRRAIEARTLSEWTRLSLCPIFVAGDPEPRILFKQIASRYETGIADLSDSSRDVISVPDRTNGKPVTLGIAICSEFVMESMGEDATLFKSQADEPLNQADINIVVSWTPEARPFVEKAESFLRARRHGVRASFLFVNSALYGGTFIMCKGDSDHATYSGSIRSEAGLECVLYRDVPFGAGVAHTRTTTPAETVLICPRSARQRSLWAQLHALIRGEHLPSEVSLTPPTWSLPPVLRLVADLVARAPSIPRTALVASEEKLASCILLDPDESISGLVQALLFNYFDYYSNLLRGPNWSTEYSAMIALLLELIDRAKSAHLVDVEQSIVVPPLTPQPASAAGDESWARWVTHRSGSRFTFGIRVISVPLEDYGIAYQARFVGQIVELLNNADVVHSIELRVVKSALRTGSADEIHIFLIFDLAQYLSFDQATRVAQEVFKICDDRLLTFRLTPVNVNSDWFRDFGVVHTPRSRLYHIGRKTEPDGSTYAFGGRGETASIVKLQASLIGASRFSVQLMSSASGSPHTGRLIWQEETTEARKANPLRGVVQTSVQDLQDLQDAHVSMQFQPHLFRPGTLTGMTPSIPADIVFESEDDSLLAAPSFIAYELAGPGRYIVSLEPRSTWLSEQEVYHVFRLPFGRLPGFGKRAPSFSIDDDLLSETTRGLLLGEISTKKQGRRAFYLDDEARRRHVWVIGKTGTGKSYFLSSMISRDILSDKGVMVIDPHGDLVDQVLARIPRNRIGDVVLFDASDTTHPPGLNLFETDLTDSFQRSLVMEEAVSLFLKLHGAEIFGPRIQQYFRGATLSVMDYALSRNRYPTLLDISRIFVDDRFRADVRKATRDPAALLFWKEFDATGGKERQEMVPFFQSKFGPLLSNRLIRGIIGQERSTIRLREFIGSKAIVLVRLSKGLIGDTNSSLLGLILVAQVYSAVMGRAVLQTDERSTFGVYVDEFQNYASETFSVLLSEARKFGLSLVLANQYLGQLRASPANHQTRAAAESTLLDGLTGNVGSIVAFQVGRHDAEILGNEIRSTGLSLEAAETIKALTELDSYQALLSSRVAGRRLPCALLYSLPWDGFEDKSYGRMLAEFLRLRYCEPAADVHAEIDCEIFRTIHR